MAPPRHKRWIPILVGTALLAAFLVWAFRPRPVPVDLATAARAPLVVAVEEDGATRIRERFTIAAPLAGQLHRVALRAGDPVSAGETVLATITPTAPELLDPRARAQAEARAASAAAAVDEADARLESAGIEVDRATREFERGAELLEGQVLSRQAYDQLEERLLVAESAVKAARYAKRVAEFELAQARAVLEHETAEGDGSRQVLTAPVSGQVLRVFEESATIVSPGQALLELGDPTDLEIVVDVLSQDAVAITPGARVVIDHWGGDAPLQGRVRRVEPSAYTKVSALGVEEQRVDVIIDLAAPVDARPGLADGFRVEAAIVTWEGDDVLQLPVGALFRQEGEWAAFLVEDGRARLRTLAVGRRNATAAEIVDGLEAGERVVLYPGDKVADGVALRPRADEGPATPSS